jgi:hypothetical protein
MQTILHKDDSENLVNNVVTGIDNNSCSIRETNFRLDTFCIADEGTKCINTENKSDDNINVNINVNIYRYKFTDNFTNELYKFSKIHQYDHRKDFKEAWEIWVEDTDELVTEEVRRLTNLGYDGNILDKMYKSARYYFRKKSTEKKAPQKRREYHSVQKDLLETMDEHIKTNINVANYKPSEGFDKFCNENIDLLKEEVNILCRNGFTNSVEIKNKIKKTYKNRYFLIISK